MRQQYQAYGHVLEAYEQVVVWHGAAGAAAQLPPPTPRKPDRPQPQYGPYRYGARAWNSWRRAVIEAGRALASGKERKADVRFVLTNIQGASHRLYKRLYCPWGESENWVKELEGGIRGRRARIACAWQGVHAALAEFHVWQRAFRGSAA